MPAALAALPILVAMLAMAVLRWQGWQGFAYHLQWFWVVPGFLVRTFWWQGLQQKPPAARCS